MFLCCWDVNQWAVHHELAHERRCRSTIHWEKKASSPINAPQPSFSRPLERMGRWRMIRLDTNEREKPIYFKKKKVKTQAKRNQEKQKQRRAQETRNKNTKKNNNNVQQRLKHTKRKGARKAWRKTWRGWWGSWPTACLAVRLKHTQLMMVKKKRSLTVFQILPTAIFRSTFRRKPRTLK